MNDPMNTSRKILQGANWNEPEDGFTQLFYEQNLSQFWRAEDISLQGDLNVWNQLSPQVQLAYSRNLLVLTFLDTYQGDVGMPVVERSLPERFHQRKAVLNFMGAMENAVHAKSYSNIFSTYMLTPDINDLFTWGDNNESLQTIMTLLVGHYEALDVQTHRLKAHRIAPDTHFLCAQWKAMCSSIFLESWLFYSGFYYPLYFYGQGKLMQAGEIINLILRDESVHGLYVGLLAQEVFAQLSAETQVDLKLWMNDFLQQLYQAQSQLVRDIYSEVDLVEDVSIFVRYNANKALMNLGFEPHFPEEEVNPVVLNGLNTETKTMDNFSMKGNGYQKMISKALTEDDFVFTAPKINNYARGL